MGLFIGLNIIMEDSNRNRDVIEFWISTVRRWEFLEDINKVKDLFCIDYFLRRTETEAIQFKKMLKVDMRFEHSKESIILAVALTAKTCLHAMERIF